VNLKIMLLNPDETTVSNTMVDDVTVLMVDMPAVVELGEYVLSDEARFKVEVINVTPAAWNTLGKSGD
jgi:hypothetical protein